MTDTKTMTVERDDPDNTTTITLSFDERGLLAISGTTKSGTNWTDRWKPQTIRILAFAILEMTEPPD